MEEKEKVVLDAARKYGELLAEGGAASDFKSWIEGEGGRQLYVAELHLLFAARFLHDGAKELFAGPPMPKVVIEPGDTADPSVEDLIRRANDDIPF